MKITALVTLAVLAVPALAQPQQQQEPTRNDFSYLQQWRSIHAGSAAVEAGAEYNTRTHDESKSATARLGLSSHFELQASLNGLQSPYSAGISLRGQLGHYAQNRLLTGLQLGYSPDVDDRYSATLFGSLFHDGANLTFNYGAARSDLRFGVPFHYWTPTRAFWGVGYMGRDQVPQGRYPSRLGLEVVGRDGNVLAGPTLVQDYGHVRLRLSYGRAVNNRNVESDRLKAAVEVGF